MRVDENGLLTVLKDILNDSDEPLDCHALYEITAVRDRAASVSRVSDYLGNLWRQGVVTRVAAPKVEGSRARWLYGRKGPKKPKPTAAPAPTTLSPSVRGDQALSNRPHIVISEEDGSITIELDRLLITIRQRPE